MIYQIQIKSIIDTSINYIAGYMSRDNLEILNLSIEYNYLSFSSPGNATIVGFKNSDLNRNSIKTGDIIFIYENNVLIYVGYIITTKFNLSSEGILLQIIFDTLLSQFSRQMMISTSEDVKEIITLSPQTETSVVNTDYVANIMPFQQLINFMIRDSIYEYARNNYQFTSSNSNRGVIYEDESTLNSKTKTYYYAAVGFTKEQVLRQTLYPYQQIVYQDSSGNLRFSVPSYSNKSSLNVIFGSPNVIDITYIDSQVLVNNYIISTLIYYGIFPIASNQTENLMTLATPNPKYFPYLNQLLDSGYYTQSLVDVRNLNSDIAKNASLLNAFEIFNSSERKNLGTPSQTPQNTNVTTPTITPLFAKRILAESLTNSKNVIVLLVRTADYTEIPLGKIISIENESWINIKCELIFAANEDGALNTIKLTGAPLSSCTGGWQT